MVREVPGVQNHVRPDLLHKHAHQGDAERVVVQIRNVQNAHAGARGAVRAANPVQGQEKVRQVARQHIHLVGQGIGILDAFLDQGGDFRGA